MSPIDEQLATHNIYIEFDQLYYSYNFFLMGIHFKKKHSILVTYFQILTIRDTPVKENNNVMSNNWLKHI